MVFTDKKNDEEVSLLSSMERKATSVCSVERAECIEVGSEAFLINGH